MATENDKTFGTGNVDEDVPKKYDDKHGRYKDKEPASSPSRPSIPTPFRVKE